MQKGDATREDFGTKFIKSQFEEYYQRNFALGCKNLSTCVRKSHGRVAILIKILLGIPTVEEGNAETITTETMRTINNNSTIIELAAYCN